MKYMLCNDNLLVIRISYLFAWKMEDITSKCVIQMLFMMSMNQWIVNICNFTANFKTTVHICLKKIELSTSVRSVLLCIPHCFNFKNNTFASTVHRNLKMPK